MEALKNIRNHIVRLVALRSLRLEIDHRLLREAVVRIHLRFDIGDELLRRTVRRLGHTLQLDFVLALGEEIVIRNVRSLELGVLQIHGRIGRINNSRLDLGQAFKEGRSIFGLAKVNAIFIFVYLVKADFILID